jgi:hypothetical protein
VLKEGGESRSAEDHRGPGLYLQVVGSTVPPTSYVVCLEALAKAIDFVRNLRGYPLCPGVKQYWSSCSSRSLAQLAVGLMSDEAKAAVATRGSSVVQDAPNIQSGDFHDGRGLYLQVVGKAARTTMYVGKSDVSVGDAFAPGSRLSMRSRPVLSRRTHR